MRIIWQNKENIYKSGKIQGVKCLFKWFFLVELTATVDPFFPTPPVNITEAFPYAINPNVNTAK